MITSESNLVFTGSKTTYHGFVIIPGETYLVKTTKHYVYPVSIIVTNIKTLESQVMCYASWEKFLENWRIQ